MTPSEKPKVKAIIFDCFGVLATDGWLPFKSKHFKKDTSLFERATDLNKIVDAGLDSYENFIGEISNLAGVSKTEAEKAIESNIPNAELFDYIKKSLKPKYKLGILSNAAANWLNEMFTEEEVKLFDAVVLSFELGRVKPDPFMYETMAERLGVEANECIFIDDQERYCTAATEVGMQATRYVDVEQLKRDLSAKL